MIFLTLFYEFFKTGLFAIGGGLATIPFLREIARVYPWFTEGELADMIAISESTPGPIGINMSTYAGFKAAGAIGGIVATLSLVLPSVIVICLVSGFLKRFRESRLVKGVFYGIRPASVGLIGASILSVLYISVVNTTQLAESGDLLSSVSPFAIVLYGVCFVLNMLFKRIHPLIFVGAGAVIGVFFGQYL